MTKSSLSIDYQSAITTITRFLTGKMLSAGSDGYVVGVSGGIDSAVSAALAVRAAGKQKVLGLLMPFRSSSSSSVSDATTLCTQLGIEFQRVDISPMIDAYFPKISDDNRLRAGNKMARERMSILFDKAQERNRLVLGTGNRTEICLGYTTWYGDSACSVNPIGELYKTDVRAIARILDIPEQIITKHPTADLWEGQTDEGEIGVTYDQIDRLLRRVVDEGEVSMTKLVAEGFSQNDISRVVSYLNRNEFKRRLPDISPLGRIAIPSNIELKA